MAEFQKALIVECPPETAFQYLSDITRHPEWANNKLEVQKTSEGPISEGATFRSIGHLMGKHEGEVRIVELVPNEKIVYEADDDTGRARHTILIAPANGGSMITKSFELLETKALTFKLASPLLPIIAPRGLEQDLRKIKQRLEEAA